MVWLPVIHGILYLGSSPMGKKYPCPNCTMFRIHVEICLALAISHVAHAHSQPWPNEVPRVFLLDGAALLQSRRDLRGGNFETSLARLISEADAKLDVGPFSVMDKKVVPISGDKHDYLSICPYAWPDPNDPNGSYIGRDGYKNPDRYDLDFSDFGSFMSMKRAVVILSYAWFFTGRKAYAKHACKLLRVWFLDPEKYVKPNLNFAQAAREGGNGRWFGIVDWKDLPVLVDAIGLLGTASCWSEADQQGLVKWFDELLQWLLNSENGREAKGMKNNQAAAYDVQVVSYALFVGRTQVAQQVLRRVPHLIDTQFQPDGSQPHELRRMNSWDYSCENLSHFARLALLGRHVDVDLWAYEKDGRSINQAIQYLLPYASGKMVWPHQQVNTLQPFRLQKALMAAPVDMGCRVTAYDLLQSSAEDERLHPYYRAFGVDTCEPALPLFFSVPERPKMSYDNRSYALS